MPDSYSSDEDEKCRNETLKENLETNDGKRASRRLAKRSVRNEADETSRQVNEKIARHDKGERDRAETQDCEKEHLQRLSEW